MIAVLGIMSVTEPLAITDTELYAVTGTGKEQWIYSGFVTGGSGKYETQVVSENLPAGLTVLRFLAEALMEVNILLFPGLSLHQWEFMSHSIKLWIQEQRQFCQLQ